MADTGIFATTAEVQRKAGANANSTAAAEAYINDFMTQAESLINVMTKYNWSDAYSGLNADVKAILKEVASNIAATYIIQYDMGGFNSLREAEAMLDVLNNAINRGLSVLRDIAKRDFTQNA